MKSRTMLLGVCALAVGMVPARGDEAMDIAKKVTSEGASMISAKDLEAIVRTYAEDSQVELISRNDATGGLKRDQHTGKGEIRKLYQELFKTDGSINARNVVETARFVGPDLLLITGTFEASAGGNSSVFPFVQVRTKRDGAWLLTHVQIFTGGN